MRVWVVRAPQGLVVSCKYHRDTLLSKRKKKKNLITEDIHCWERNEEELHIPNKAKPVKSNNLIAYMIEEKKEEE